MRVWHLSLLMATASCGTEVLQIDLPDAPTKFKSMLVGSLYDGRLSANAIDLRTAPATWELPAVERRSGSIRFFAMYCPDSLEEMGINSGPLALATDGERPCKPRFDPRFDPPPDKKEVHQRTVSSGDDGFWDSVGELSPDLQFTLPTTPVDESNCRPLDILAYDLPINGRVTVALPQADGSIFAVGIKGEGFRIDDTGISELGQIVPDAVLSGTKTSSGVTWLSGHDGRLWAGRPEEGFRLARTLQHGETTRYLAGSTPDLAIPAAAELLVLSRTGTFDHLGPEGTLRDAQILEETAASERQGGLYWLGLDRVAALVPGSGRYYRVDAGEVIPYDPPPEVYGRVVDIAANYGGVFGITSNGYLIRYNGQEQKLSLEIQLDNALSDPRLISLDDGFLLVNRPSTLRHWYRPSGLDAKPGEVPPNIICPAVAAPAGDSILWAHTIVDEKAYLFMSRFDDWDAVPATMLVVDFSGR